ncbi:MAG: hypothetical protein QM536_03050, partial [Chitinophagaceae bacterium]|nr:hypothetical protein [Chitinophagaceae bacterium]
EKERAEKEKARAEQTEIYLQQEKERTEQEKKMIVKNLLLKGMDNIFISEITGLPVETIQKIRETYSL